MLEATGSILTNKVAEGYPGRRYFSGCENIAESLGFETINVIDKSYQLLVHYTKLRDSVIAHYEELSQKCTAEFLESSKNGLCQWVESAEQGLFTWGLFHFRRS